ncbi:hydrophobin-1 precursor [Rhizopogon salebrosus TDB-379]|nr:hydrophobin-1 precursor [Rhizopogon salebrosus TDB-379]
MKFASVILLVAAATVVSADTNGERMARGLPPLAPARRGTPVARAKKTSPSNSPGKCDTGSIQCCSSFGSSSHHDGLDSLLDLLNIHIPSGTPCGLSCSPFAGGNSCKQEPVCCEDNNYNGLVNIGCSPINL